MSQRKPQGNTNKKNRKKDLRSFFSDMDENTAVIVRKVTAVVLAVLAVFTFIAVISYLFSWKTDMSLLSDPEAMSRGTDTGNMGGKLGFRWGRFLVARCFGLGAFAIALLPAIFAMKLFFVNLDRNYLRTAVLTLTGAILLSLSLSYISLMFGMDTLFEGGLGGDCGAFVSSWMVNLIGSIPTVLVILIFVLAWALCSSGRFSKWLVTAGDNVSVAKRESDSTNSESHENAGADESAVGAADDSVEESVSGSDVEKVSVEKVSAGKSENDFELEKDSVGGVDNNSDIEKGSDNVADNIGQVSDESASKGEEEQFKVIDGYDLDVEVKEELPRINVRDELENYQFPSLDLLNDYAEGRHYVSNEELERNNNKIKATLQNYKIQVMNVRACTGPTVTLYKIVPAPGVKISAIRNLEEDISVALGARGVRVVTLPDSVGIEVANDRPSIVPLKNMLNDQAFRENKFELPVAVGVTITQKVKTFDLTAAPHLLVAGATQQGKSVGLNVIISSLLYAKHPSELKFVFIDPKMVEFTAYKHLIKHYLAVLPNAVNEEDEMDAAIVKKAAKAEEILRSLCLEMDERYLLMSKTTNANNVKLYNEKYKDRHLLPTDGHRYLPYIVVVIDEYSDLVMSVGTGGESKNMARSITSSIIRLAQKGRAAGIHVIIATQRPSVDVITGLIKTNFPMRIAFRTVTRVDSNTILDTPGAEKLIGKGDMLFYAGVEMERVQCAYVGMDEITKITDFIGSQTGYKQHFNTPYYLPVPESQESDNGSGGMVDMQNLDEMFKAAAEMVVINQQGSTSTLQRKLGMGYARAGRVMDQLEAAGIVGPQEGSKPRQVLVQDLNELEGILKAYMN